MIDDDDDDVKSYQFKVILVGDGAVGKTSISIRFAEDQFSQQYKQTIGVDFFTKKIEVHPRANVTIQLWDIGGQSIGSKMLSSYIAGAHAVLLCYDITNYESFANLEDWFRLVNKAFQGRSKAMPYCALIGNKNDLRYLSAVTAEQHNQFADENALSSYLMSAKNGDQVMSTFLRIASQLAGVPVEARNPNGVEERAVIPATILDHKQHSEEVEGGKMPSINAKNDGYGCVLS
eukprot:GSChrysophyteH1.ASY1.ANO1.2325.1 assembled CDS